MKKIAFLLLLPAIAFAQKNVGFKIKGNLKGLKDSTLVFLIDPSGNTIAQDYAIKGNFTLQAKSEEATFYQVGLIGMKDELIDLFSFNDDISISGDVAHLSKAQVIGGKLQEDYNSYTSSFNPLKDKLNVLYEKINKEKPGPKRDSIINVFNQSRSKVIELVGNFLKTKPTSPVSAFVLYVVNPLFSGPGELETKYNLLADNAKKGVYARLIEKLISDTKVGNAGTPATDFTQNDTANKPVSLSSFRGKYVLVDFWASWCRPCRAENPNVVAAYNTYKNKNFTVLSVSLDQQRENWIRAINDDKLTWTHVSDLKYWSNAVAQLYKIQSIPQNLLVDPNGMIIARNLRGEELIQKLESILK